MGWLATPHVSYSFLPTAVKRQSDRTAVHTGTCSQTTTEVTVRTPEGGNWKHVQDLGELYTGGGLLAGSSRGPPSCHYSTVHKQFSNTSAASFPPPRAHLDLVPRHQRSDQELQANFTFKLKAGSVVYLPLNFLQQLAQRLTQKCCWIPGSKWWKKCNLEGKPNAPQEHTQIEREVRCRLPDFYSLSSNPIPGLIHHRHVRSILN